MENNTIRTTLKLNWGMLLSVIFVILKLCHVIEWSWIWVLSPLWISFAVSVVIIIIAAVFSKEGG